MFRKHNWSPQADAHGWVRRRRWIRLMVRPAKQKKKVERDGFNTPDSTAWIRPQSSSSPPSIFASGTDIMDHWLQVEPSDVWLGDPENDWQRCLSVMKSLGRDGRKLELWSSWLGCYDPDQSPGVNAKGKQPEGEIEKPLPSDIFPADTLSRDSVPIAASEHIMAVLRKHLQHLLHLFIFPESRVRFLRLLSQAGLWSELNNGSESTEVGFWSYVNRLGSGEVPKSKTESLPC